MSASTTINADALQVVLRKGRAHDESANGGFSLDVEFAVAPGFTVLFGPSGAGKTTILDCIAGLQNPDNGRVSVAGVDLFDSERSVDVSTRCRRLGYLFQTVALFPHLTGKQNIEYGLSSLPEQERASRIARSGRIIRYFRDLAAASRADVRR